MDERFETAKKSCLENITKATLASSEKFRNADEAFKESLLNVIITAAAAAFGQGYDAGYCNGVDDIRDVD